MERVGNQRACPLSRVLTLLELRLNPDVLLFTNTPLPWEPYCWVHWQHYPLFGSFEKCQPLQVFNQVLLFFFFFFLNSVLYHLNVKFRALLLGNVWSIPTTLQKCSKLWGEKYLKSLWGHTCGSLLLRTKTSYSRDYICQEGKDKIRLTAETTIQQDPRF